MSDTSQIITFAWKSHFSLPSFNIPHLPMMRPIIEAVEAADAFALISVARLEWVKFQSGSARKVRDEYQRCTEGTDSTRHTRLHLDHIPVIDEDDQRVDYLTIIQDALDAGYESVMVDGSRLPFEENVEATAAVVKMAHNVGIPVEAELGAVLGHESGPLPPYEELFQSKQGFTDTGEARRFVEQTGVDWLSVSFGNIHGAISKAKRNDKKPAAKLDIEHLKELAAATGVPLVLHGGSGIQRSYVDRAIEHGIAKINIGTDLRRAYETALEGGAEAAAAAVSEATTAALDQLHLRGKGGEVVAWLEKRST